MRCSTDKLSTAFAGVAIVLTIATSGLAQPLSLPCDLPEIVFSTEVRRSYQEYNHLVCKGVEEISLGDYGRAVDTLEAASAINFHEDVNYMLYPRLALAHFLNGDEVVSKHLLEQSRLAMLVHAGLRRCRYAPEQQSYVIVDNNGRQEESDAHDAVRDRMCAPFTEEDYYEARSLKEFADKSRLVELYFHVRDQIATK